MKVLFCYLSLALFVTKALKIENQSISIGVMPTSTAQYIPVYIAALPFAHKNVI